MIHVNINSLLKSWVLSFRLGVNLKVVIIGTVASSIFGFRKPLIKEILKKGHDVYAMAIDYTDENKKELIAWGVKPVDYKLSRSGLNPIADLKTMFTLKTLLQKIKPDIVFSYFVKPVIYGTLAAKLAKVPKRIAMLEGLGFAFTNQPEEGFLKTRLIKKVQVLLYRVALPAATNLLFLNPDDRDELLTTHRIKSGAINVIGGIGVDLQEFKYKVPTNTKVQFLFIGRLLKEKGIFDFLKAAEIVKKRYPSSEFTVLGKSDTTSPNALSDTDLRHYIDNKIIFYPGQVDNIANWIESSSVFVLPSYREGVPMSIQEAMAIGRPILTTDVPGCRETVLEGKNGFLVPAFDVEKLVKKMFWFIEHSQNIESMGIASRKMAEEKFDVTKVNKKLLNIMGLDK